MRHPNLGLTHAHSRRRMSKQARVGGAAADSASLLGMQRQSSAGLGLPAALHLTRATSAPLSGPTAASRFARSTFGSPRPASAFAAAASSTDSPPLSAAASTTSAVSWPPGAWLQRI